MAKEKKNKEKTNVVLPKAWQSVKHRNETAQARANYDDTWKAIGTLRKNYGCQRGLREVCFCQAKSIYGGAVGAGDCGL